MSTPQILNRKSATEPGDSPEKGRPKPKVRHPTPEALADVALIDAITCAATGCMGVSWWLAEVAAGRAPAPVIREPRCTRWSLAHVRAYWLARIERAATNTQAAECMKERATKASHKARANRAAAASAAAPAKAR